jgi:hypothetical protein
VVQLGYTARGAVAVIVELMSGSGIATVAVGDGTGSGSGVVPGGGGETSWDAEGVGSAVAVGVPWDRRSRTSSTPEAATAPARTALATMTARRLALTP